MLDRSSSTAISWTLSAGLHGALLLAAACSIGYQFVTIGGAGGSSPTYQCGWMEYPNLLERVEIPIERWGRIPLQMEPPPALFGEQASLGVDLSGFPGELPYHNCGSCRCFDYLYELPAPVLLALSLKWWKPQVLRNDLQGQTSLPFQRTDVMIRRRYNGSRIGIYTWK
jgi:hypothetical protein